MFVSLGDQIHKVMLRHMRKRYSTIEDLYELASVDTKRKVLYSRQISHLSSVLSDMNNDSIGTEVIDGYIRYTVNDKGLDVKDSLKRNVLFINEKGIFSGGMRIRDKSKFSIIIHDYIKVSDFKEGLDEMKSLWSRLNLSNGIIKSKFI